MRIAAIVAGVLLAAAFYVKPLQADISVSVTIQDNDSAETANLWIDTDGGGCARNAIPATYNNATACDSMQAATSAASSGDTVRIKSGTYIAHQSPGDASKAITFIGEDGARVDSGSNHNFGMCFSGNATVRNFDVGGETPFVCFTGANNTWEDSTFEAGSGERSCTNNDAEPILIYDNVGTVANTTLRRIVVGQQKGALGDTSGCTAGDPYHLEMIRIDQNVDGVLIDSVTFAACPNGAGFAGCGSGQIFITTPNSGTFEPTNIKIRNSKFYGTVNYHIQIHSNVVLDNSEFAYNTFGTSEPIGFEHALADLRLVGNLGTRPQSCWSGVTFVKNVWQWATGSPCGTDTLVTGDSFSTDQLGINSTTLDLEAGSPAIDTAESTCMATANSEDHEGDVRPNGSACDAGADEA